MAWAWGTSEFQVQIQGIDKLARDARATGVRLKDLRQLTKKLAWPIARRARALAPKGPTKKLSRGIKPASGPLAVRVAVGDKDRLPYAARRHWGDDGNSGPQWLSRAEEELRGATIKGFADGINEILRQYRWE